MVMVASARLEGMDRGDRMGGGSRARDLIVQTGLSALSRPRDLVTPALFPSTFPFLFPSLAFPFCAPSPRGLLSFGT